MKNLTKLNSIKKNLSTLEGRISDIGRLNNHGLNDYGFAMAGDLKWKLEDYEYNMTINDIYDRRAKEIEDLSSMIPALIRDEKINKILS